MRRCCVFAVAVLAVATLDARAGLTINIDARVNSLDNPVLVDFDPGEWVLEPINTDMGGAYTAWDAWGTSEKWLNFYVIESPSIPQTKVGDWGVTYPTPTEAFAHASAFTFTLSLPETVRLSITDRTAMSWDNQGGISLYVDTGNPPAVPLPAGIGLAAAGVVTLCRFRKILIT